MLRRVEIVEIVETSWKWCKKVEIKAGGALSGKLKVEAVRSVRLELGCNSIPYTKP